MTRVLVTFAGGSYGLGITRSLYAADHGYEVIAADSDRYSLMRAEADVRRLIPFADDLNFIPALRSLIDEFGVDFLWPGHDSEIESVALHRDELDTASFLPPMADIEICNDKLASHKKWVSAGVPVPDTSLINNRSDLEDAFERHRGKVWLRTVSGAGGRGALGVSELRKAEAWLTLHDGWGKFTAAEWIEGGERLSWESVWSNGYLVTVQGRRQLVQGFAGLTMTGITGVPGINQWGVPDGVDEVGMAAVNAISERPHGNYGVDMITDSDVNLYVTEINIGRFNNDGLIHWPDRKLNAADLAVKLGMGEGPPFKTPLMHPKPHGDVIIYGVPKMPIQTPEDKLPG